MLMLNFKCLSILMKNDNDDEELNVPWMIKKKTIN